MIRIGCFLALVLMALAGCQSVDYYKPPVGVTPTTAATLMGSRAENPSPFRKDLRAYVARIDGKLTGGGPNAWDQPVLITAGKHDIAIGVAGGENMFASNSRFGLVEARATLQTGMTYYLRAAIRQESALHGAQAVAWIEDEHGVTATEELAVLIAPVRYMVMPVMIPVK